jgi:hypothetical protein
MAPETAESVRAEQARYPNKLDWVVSQHNPFPIGDLHNVLAQYRLGRERCLDGGYDALLTVEHDMLLPPGAVAELANTPGDVVYGVYRFRWGATVLNACEYIDDQQRGAPLWMNTSQAAEARQAGVVQVSGVGWGCTLIPRATLERIEFPERCEENPAFDLVFAERCLRAGLRLVANFRVLCGHRRTAVDIRNTQRTDVQRSEILWPFRKTVTRPPNAAVVMRQTVDNMEAGRGYLVSQALAANLVHARCAEMIDAH